MLRLFKTILAGTFALGLGTAAFAGGDATSWTLDGENSRIAFGSIKKDTVGESHGFEAISGTISADGSAEISIDLATVQTNIDIRNERMIEHVFKGMANATITGSLDIEEASDLEVGAFSLIDFEGKLSLVGTEIELEAEMFVMRVSQTQVIVTNNDLIFIGTEAAGINAGIDKLMELAKLPGITRTSPVMLRLILNSDMKKAEVAPAAPANIRFAMGGDIKKGKKVFKKCKACHSVKAEKNGAGPSLHGLMGATAGQVEGFKYSDEMVASGIVWNEETLAGFLANPRDYLEGTTMSFKGLKKEKDLSDVIAYLADATAE